MAAVSSEEKTDNASSKYTQCYSENPKGYVPYSQSVKGLLTDLYQITMTYAYWKNGDMEKQAVFDLFFRKCPFKGEFCIFAGLDEVLRFLNTFGYSDNDIKMLKHSFPTWNPKLSARYFCFIFDFLFVLLFFFFFFCVVYYVFFFILFVLVFVGAFFFRCCCCGVKGFGNIWQQLMQVHYVFMLKKKEV